MTRTLPPVSLAILRNLAGALGKARSEYNLAVSATFAALNVPPEKIVGINLEKGTITLKDEPDGNQD